MNYYDEFIKIKRERLPHFIDLLIQYNFDEMPEFLEIFIPLSELACQLKNDPSNLEIYNKLMEGLPNLQRVYESLCKHHITPKSFMVFVEKWSHIFNPEEILSMCRFVGADEEKVKEYLSK